MERETFFRTLATKRMAAGAMIRNESGELLLVKPTYKDTWEIPGGCIESDESPLSGCVREIKEELGLDVSLNRLLCVDYTVSQGERTEALQFLFVGPILSHHAIAKIRIPKDELQEYRFVDGSKAYGLLGPRLRKRVECCLPRIDEGVTFYLENGAVP